LRIAPSIVGKPLNVDIVGPMLADVVTNHVSWLGRRRERIELDGVTLLLRPAEAAIAFPPAGSDPAAAESAECSDALPYGSAAQRAALGEPGVYHFAAHENGALVGHAVLNVAGATAGVYAMGVAERYRRRGHGLALARAAIARAGELGCSSVTLNATGEGEPMYSCSGFASLGLGMTWWMFPQRPRP
jgi:GNAT superfamily N-acetyltransferase